MGALRGPTAGSRKKVAKRAEKNEREHVLALLNETIGSLRWWKEGYAPKHPEEEFNENFVDLYKYRAYENWCRDNLEKLLSQKSFTQFLRQNERIYGISYSKHIMDDQRGFHGVHVKYLN